MNTQNEKAGSPRQEALEAVIAELERSLTTLESNYRHAVSTLQVLRKSVETDDLTRLLRRGAFMEKLRTLMNSALTSSQPICIMMIDVDHFKKVNDSYGHQTGDIVLERVSELIRQYMRPCDLAGRFGGEEVIVAVQGDLALARELADRIRCAVEAHTMTCSSRSEEVEFTVTLSIGVASSSDFGLNGDRLIGAADEALYEAKRTGRNKVINARPQPKTEYTLEIAEPMAA